MARKNPEKASQVKKNYEKWRNYWSNNNKQYDDFMQFVMGSQWDYQEARVFEDYQKVPLTFNKVAPLINHILGEQRQNTPSLEIIPDDNVPEQAAETREALVKDICFDSQSKEVFQTAFQSALIGGFGALLVNTEYVDNDSFNQVIKFERQLIPTRCFWDMAAKNPCKTDGMYCGYNERVSRTMARGIYGKIIDNISNEVLTDNTPFNDDDAVTFTYYWERKYKTTTLYHLSTGETIDSKEFEKIEKQETDGVELLFYKGQSVEVINTRLVPRYSVKYYLFAGEYELDKTDFPSEQLPLIFVDQSSFIDKTGKQVCRPFVKDAKDAQKYLNYIGTQAAYLLKITRFDQFIGSKENVRSNDTALQWRDPLKVKGILTYDESSSGAKPEQLRPPEISQSLSIQYERAMNDISTSTGVYNAQIGNQSNEISGVAIDARTKRGAYNTYIPFDNLNRAIACSGQIVNEMIPKVYDTERTLMLNMKDRGIQPVTINKSMDLYGSKMENDMVEGNYKIRLMPGPSWEGAKQEALESMQLILQSSPQVFPMIADLYVENLPLTNSIELRNRLRTMVPPEIIQAGKSGQPLPPKPPEPNPQMIAAQAKIEDLKLKQQKLQLDAQKLKMDDEEHRHDLEIKWNELETDRLKMAAELEETQMRYMSENARTQSDERMKHADNLIKILTHKGNENHAINERR